MCHLTIIILQWLFTGHFPPPLQCRRTYNVHPCFWILRQLGIKEALPRCHPVEHGHQS